MFAGRLHVHIYIGLSSNIDTFQIIEVKQFLEMYMQCTMKF